MTKPDTNPMHSAPRCSAKSKRTGDPCKSPAVRGWTVCRMHGARGGAPTGQANGSWRHGERSKHADQFRQALKALVGLAQDGIKVSTD